MPTKKRLQGRRNRQIINCNAGARRYILGALENAHQSVPTDSRRMGRAGGLVVAAELVHARREPALALSESRRVVLLGLSRHVFLPGLSRGSGRIRHFLHLSGVFVMGLSRTTIV